MHGEPPNSQRSLEAATEQTDAEASIPPKSALPLDPLPANSSPQDSSIPSHSSPIDRTVREINDHFLQESIFMGLASASELLLATDETSSALTQALSIIGTAARLEHISLFKINDQQAQNDTDKFHLKAMWPKDKWKRLLGQLEHYQRFLGDELSKQFIELERGDICVKSASVLHDLLSYSAEDALIGSIALCPIHFKQDFWGITVLGTSQSMLLSEQALLQLSIGVSGVFGGAVSKIEIENRLRYQALHDPLTKLPNRTLFIDRLEQILKHSQRERAYQFTVLYLDLDRFKLVNDNLGHAIGDQLLKKVAQRLVDCIRPRDTVARLGGDEFAILLEDIYAEEHILTIIERIHGELTRAFMIQCHNITCGTSIGISHCHHQFCTPDSILHHADMAMYQAKQSQTEYYKFCEFPTQQQEKHKFTVNHDIFSAIENQQLHIFYQPVMLLNSLQVQGLTADIRWQHPDLGWLAADQLISLAASHDMSHAIFDYELHGLCRYIQDLQTNYRLSNVFSISLNCCENLIMQPHFLALIQDTLAQYKIEAKRIKLEFSEAFLIKNIDIVSPRLTTLKQLGIELIVNQFGSDDASLRYLQYLPVDALKIDATVIHNLEDVSPSLDRLKAIVSLSYNLGLGIIAADISTPKQLAILQQLRVDYGQGDCLTRPLDATASLRYLAHHLVARRPFKPAV